MDDHVYETISDFWVQLRKKIDQLPKRPARDKTQWSNNLNVEQDKIGIYLGKSKIWLYIKSGESETSLDRTQRMRLYSTAIRNSIVDQDIYNRNAESDGRSIGIKKEWTRLNRGEWPEVVQWVSSQFEALKAIIENEFGEIVLEGITSETDDSQSSLPVYQIATYPADYTLEVLYKKWKDKEISVPKFQRSFVWKQNQSSRLIESFLAGLPVPAIFLYTVRASQDYLVIDGQQRLRSVFYFFDGHFGEAVNGIKRPFQLTGLNEASEYSGRTFDTLEHHDQKKLKNATLRAFIVMQLEPHDDTSMFHIFERLNTGSTALTNQEIRDCVYDGDLSEFLDELNQLKEWRAILGKHAPDSRKRDIELILRFFAMRGVGKYKKPMKIFLNSFMKKNRNPSQSKLADLRKEFEGTCQAVVEHLGNRPFHVKSGLNAAVFDAVMVAFANGLTVIPNDVSSRYQRLIMDETFQKNVSSRTTDEKVVARRFHAAATQLFNK